MKTTMCKFAYMLSADEENYEIVTFVYMSFTFSNLLITTYPRLVLDGLVVSEWSLVVG